jgi:hypothetical protein
LANALHLARGLRELVLRGPRHLADLAAEVDRGDDDRRHDAEHQQRELHVDHEQQHEAAGHLDAVAERHRQLAADHALDDGDVRREPPDQLAAAALVEPRERQGQDPVEHQAAQVRHHALAEPAHAVVAQPDEHRVHDEHAAQPEHDQVQIVGGARTHADVDRHARRPRIDEVDPRRGEQRDQRQHEPVAVRADQRHQPPQHREPPAVARPVLLLRLAVAGVRPVRFAHLAGCIARSPVHVIAMRQT